MKLLLLFLSLLTTDPGCSTAKLNQEEIVLEYSAVSRGKYQHIRINKEHILVQNSRNANPKVILCSQTQWKIIMKLLKTIDLETIPKLEAPTQKRLFDGAAIANLTVTYNTKSYKTPSFDHGSPHQSIAPLIKEILSIAKNIE